MCACIPSTMNRALPRRQTAHCSRRAASCANNAHSVLRSHFHAYRTTWFRTSTARGCHNVSDTERRETTHDGRNGRSGVSNRAVRGMPDHRTLHVGIYLLHPQEPRMLLGSALSPCTLPPDGSERQVDIGMQFGPPDRPAKV